MTKYIEFCEEFIELLECSGVYYKFKGDLIIFYNQDSKYAQKYNKTEVKWGSDKEITLNKPLVNNIDITEKDGKHYIIFEVPKEWRKDNVRD